VITLEGKEMISKGINTHLSMAHVIAGAYVNQTCIHLILTGDKDVVPLGELGIADFLIDLTRGTIDSALVAQFMVVLVNLLTVISSLFRNGKNDNLAG
jgi:hypothetical protein